MIFFLHFYKKKSEDFSCSIAFSIFVGGHTSFSNSVDDLAGSKKDTGRICSFFSMTACVMFVEGFIFQYQRIFLFCAQNSIEIINRLK